MNTIDSINIYGTINTINRVLEINRKSLSKNIFCLKCVNRRPASACLHAIYAATVNNCSSANSTSHRERGESQTKRGNLAWDSSEPYFATEDRQAAGALGMVKMNEEVEMRSRGLITKSATGTSLAIVKRREQDRCLRLSGRVERGGTCTYEVQHRQQTYKASYRGIGVKRDWCASQSTVFFECLTSSPFNRAIVARATAGLFAL